MSDEAPHDGQDSGDASQSVVGLTAEEADAMTDALWEKTWTDEEREEYMAGMGDWEHPLFSEHLDPENPYVKALQQMVDDEGGPVEKADRLREEGNKLFTQGRFLREAEVAYSEAAAYAHECEQTPEVKRMYSQILSNRAAVNLKIGRFDRVVLDTDRALQYWPENDKAAFRGAKAMLELGNGARAAKLAERALALKPDSGAVKKLLARCHARAKSQAEARAAHAAAQREREARRDALADACLRLRLRVAPPEQTDARGEEMLARAYVEDGTLHAPVRVVYPEHGWEDLAESVQCDIALEDVLKALVLPPGQQAWDRRGQYGPDRVAALTPARGADGEVLTWIWLPLDDCLQNRMQHRLYKLRGAIELFIVPLNTPFYDSFAAKVARESK